MEDFLFTESEKKMEGGVEMKEGAFYLRVDRSSVIQYKHSMTRVVTMEREGEGQSLQNPALGGL